MKRLYTYFMVILLLFIVGCTKPIVADTIPETITVYETVITTEIVEIENTQRIDELELELQQYKELISNLNELLSNVYYGMADSDLYTYDGFTGFSVEYDGKYYILTAGHCVETKEYGKAYNHRFKANYSNEWVYPELIAYHTGFADDYAIFYSDKIMSGFKITDKPDYNNLYILGHLQTIKKISDGDFINGESGSPIIDLKGNAVGIVNTAGGIYTLIDSVLDKIK